jgi:transposase
MSIVGAFDVHRRQLTFEYLDTVTGELRRGRVAPADREHLREWLARFAGQDDVHFALEGCTGWRYVAEELAAAGAGPHVAEPADTAALRGRKRHAKTDKTDTRHLRVHLLAGDLPECWIPPAHVLEARAVVRLYKDLLDERGGWHQRIAATLFHQGVPAGIGSMCTADGRAAVAGVDLSPAGRQAVQTGLRQIERLTGELDPLRRQLGMLSRRQPGCRALRAAHFGIGPVTSVAIWAELGDVRRFANSADAVRHTGLDITVCSSDTKRSAGHLSRQGPPLKCAGHYMRRPSPPPGPQRPTTPTIAQPVTGATPGWPPCRWPASSPAAPTTPCVTSGRTPCGPPREPASHLWLPARAPLHR